PQWVDEPHGFGKARRRVEHWRHHREDTGGASECRRERLRIREIGNSDLAAQLRPGGTATAIPDYRPHALIGGKKAAGHRCADFSGNASNCKHKRSCFSVNRPCERGQYYPRAAFVLK